MEFGSKCCGTNRVCGVNSCSSIVWNSRSFIGWRGVVYNAAKSTEIGNDVHETSWIYLLILVAFAQTRH